MEKFMLIFEGIKSSQQPSAKEMEAIMAKWMTWIDKLAKAGKYDSGEPLLPTGKIIKGANKTVTDAAFAEGKEIIGGYFIINAADYNEAVALCADYPDFENGGSVIIRQVQKMDMPS
ncbi:MAG TPA: YciI family protein [Ferruginibacter sp.]|nr:YciI family protein [Ferruginibacter sp.]